jgi:hypothetical protein
MATNHRIATVLAKHGSDLLEQWMRQQLASVATRRDLVTDADLGE